MSDQEPEVIGLAGASEGKAVPVRFESRALRRSAVSLLAIFVAFQLAEWVFASLGRFLFLLLLAWLLSIAMEPGVTWLANHRIRRGAATGIVLISILLASIAFLAAFGSLLFSQLSELIGQLPSTITQLTTWANDTFRLTLDAGKILDQLQVSPSQIAEVASNLAGGVFGALGLIFGALFEALTVVVFAFYFSADGPRLRRAIGSWLPLKSQQVFVTVWDIAVTKTGGFVVSKVVLATMSAFFHAAFFAIIDVPYWLPMGIFAGVVSQFIPTIGTYIGVAIPAVFAAFTDPIDVVWIIVFATIYQNIESYVFTPRVSRATMDIHPAIALGSVFVGIALFGPIGAIIGIPLAAAVLAVVETYGQRHVLSDELRTRTKGEKPARVGDALAGDPAQATVPAKPASEVASADTGDAS